MNLSFCTRLYETTTAFILEISGIAGVAFDRYRFGGEMGFDVVDQDFPCTDHNGIMHKTTARNQVLFSTWEIETVLWVVVQTIWVYQ